MLHQALVSLEASWLIGFSLLASILSFHPSTCPGEEAAYAGRAEPLGDLSHSASQGRAPPLKLNSEIMRKSAILLTSCWIIKYI